MGAQLTAAHTCAAATWLGFAHVASDPIEQPQGHCALQRAPRALLQQSHPRRTTRHSWSGPPTKHVPAADQVPPAPQRASSSAAPPVLGCLCLRGYAALSALRGIAANKRQGVCRVSTLRLRGDAKASLRGLSRREIGLAMVTVAKPERIDSRAPLLRPWRSREMRRSCRRSSKGGRRMAMLLPIECREDHRSTGRHLEAACRHMPPLPPLCHQACLKGRN